MVYLIFCFFYSMYRPVQPFWELQISMLLMKNPQYFRPISSNFQGISPSCCGQSLKIWTELVKNCGFFINGVLQFLKGVLRPVENINNCWDIMYWLVYIEENISNIIHLGKCRKKRLNGCYLSYLQVIWNLQENNLQVDVDDIIL